MKKLTIGLLDRSETPRCRMCREPLLSGYNWDGGEEEICILCYDEMAEEEEREEEDD